MKTILVAVDGSEPSLKGVGMAAELARSLGARLELVYVIPPVLLPPTVYADTIKKIEEGATQHGQQLLLTASRAVPPGVEHQTVLLNGAPAEALADLSLADRVWGLVIGARGHNAVSRVLLGSVADRLVHICKKPVLVVR